MLSGKKNIQSTNNEWGYDVINNNGQLIILGSVQAQSNNNFLIQPLDSAGNPIQVPNTTTMANQIIYSGLVSSDQHLVFTGQNTVLGISQIVLVKKNYPY